MLLNRITVYEQILSIDFFSLTFQPCGCRGVIFHTTPSFLNIISVSFVDWLNCVLLTIYFWEEIMRCVGYILWFTLQNLSLKMFLISHLYINTFQVQRIISSSIWKLSCIVYCVLWIWYCIYNINKNVTVLLAKNCLWQHPGPTSCWEAKINEIG